MLDDNPAAFGRNWGGVPVRAIGRRVGAVGREWRGRRAWCRSRRLAGAGGRLANWPRWPLGQLAHVARGAVAAAIAAGTVSAPRRGVRNARMVANWPTGS